jgi:activator of HSP90 ATPase
MNRLPSFSPVHTLTRRNALVTLALAAGGLALGSRANAETNPEMKETAVTAANQARTSLHYDVMLNATPHRIYEILLGSDKFATLTGLPAEIDAKEGGAFSLFGGLIVGRNIELVPDERIVQAWRPASWDAGIYSIVRFELKAQVSKTQLVLDHTGFAEGLADHLDLGWNGHYLKPLAKMLP